MGLNLPKIYSKSCQYDGLNMRIHLTVNEFKSWFPRKTSKFKTKYFPQKTTHQICNSKIDKNFKFVLNNY